MMKDTIEGEIAPCGYDEKCIVSKPLQEKIRDYKNGDKVKILVIKED